MTKKLFSMIFIIVTQTILYMLHYIDVPSPCVWYAIFTYYIGKAYFIYIIYTIYAFFLLYLQTIAKNLYF